MKKGFTLIELLVVISIIGLLASVVLASLNTARSRARDARRMTDMRQIQTALELYFNDNGVYPSTSNVWFGVSVNGGSRGVTGAGGYIPNLAPTYIPTLPVDPLDNRSGWSGYLYLSINGSQYALLSTVIGPESFPSAGEPFYDPNRPTWAWKVCSGPPECNR
ncbi:MAG: hypothetical protein COU90_00455 [Candidatus Ryanbacteria bacterium CG10_big_fil_rev_8_21_14_0_10_43_42]|uniref:Type II secretion system protein GspG C-terminal domain-containing protein n=1 Tax=Candidatus Ryanbacteria bacterium CG10_big_fil_rev_8_21_14_0_10_43_42 TaxID=1974864 RepID=A0A2M8KXS2_9BACT|nr:MAG: hypothetical protein COU90_00455 [Candidatus Ryanbacteria bacterium CG10_big_fil_rev_8_21_14_0_10_43_42]